MLLRVSRIRCREVQQARVNNSRRGVKVSCSLELSAKVGAAQQRVFVGHSTAYLLSALLVRHRGQNPGGSLKKKRKLKIHWVSGAVG